MSTTVSIKASVGKGVSVVDESNYLAARSGSGEGTGNQGASSGQYMNVGIRSEKTKPGVNTMAHSYTITRHVMRFELLPVLPDGAVITEASLTLVSAGVTQDLTFADNDSFTYATSSVSVMAATGTGLIAASDFQTFHKSGSEGDLTDRGMSFRTYDNIISGSSIPATFDATITIPLNQNCIDDITSNPSGSIFDIGLVNTKFDKGTFLSGSQPGSNVLNDNPPDGNGQFTSPGNSHDLVGVDVHHEGAYIHAFGTFGYSTTARKPTLEYVYKVTQPGGVVKIDNKLVLSSGVVSLKSSLI
jgi:hypothetical protein